MGFGHYRISIAMASCAKALGYTPVWLDLASFDQTGSKMIVVLLNDIITMPGLPKVPNFEDMQ